MAEEIPERDKRSLVDRRRAIALGAASIGMASVATPALTKEPARRVQPAPPLPSPPVASVAPRPPSRPDPILFWNETALDLDALDHSLDAKEARAPGPCLSSRALALAHIVMADAVTVSYPDSHEGLYVRGGRGPQGEAAEVFVGAAAARILNHIYTTPAHTQLIAIRRQQFLRAYNSDMLTAWNAGLEFGRSEQFTALWDWRFLKDAALSSYKQVQGAYRGRHDVDPFNTDQKFYGANWSNVPPLLPGLPIRVFAPRDPPREHERDYARDLEEVRALGAWRPDGPTPDQVKLGLFWAYDGARLIGTPPRLYNQIVARIVESEHMSTPELARLFALCNIAMADAAIVCWEAKYRYQVWRPVLGIRKYAYGPDPYWRPFGAPRTNPPQFALGSDSHRLTALSMLGGGQQSLETPTSNILPYKKASFTPNFPAYPSGHATFGSACFSVLKQVRGERFPTRQDAGRINVTIVSDELDGVSIDNFRNVPRPYTPLSYKHIDHMIEDNNRSRVHLGVHWNFDCESGASSGRQVADYVYRKAYRLR